MAFAQRTQLGLTETSTNATVPDNDTAKLMYYLRSICSVINMSSESALNRLKDYNQYWRLDYDDKLVLLRLCVALDPDELEGKCIFMVNPGSISGSNAFFEISAVQHTFVAVSSVLIGGQRKQVTEIMAYTNGWIQRNYHSPMRGLLAELQEIQRQRERSSASCTIL